MIDEETKQLLILIHLQTESLDHRRMIEAKLRKENKMMMLSSGKMVDVTKLKAEDICIEDISNSISAMSRYAAHTGITTHYSITGGDVRKRFLPKTYSVGAHTMVMWEILTAMNAPPLAKLWALIHDFSEAYVIDVPRDFKNNPGMDWFRAIEESVQAEIVKGLFGGILENRIILSKTKYPAIQLANALDKEICLGLEMPYLMNNRRVFSENMSDVSDDELSGVIWSLMYRVAIDFTCLDLDLKKPGGWLVSQVRDHMLNDAPHKTRQKIVRIFEETKEGHDACEDWEKFQGL